MRPPVQLRVSPRPSRAAAVVIVVFAVAAFGAVVSLPTPIAVDMVAAVALFGWARHHFRRHVTRRSPRAVIEILLSSDAVIVVRRNDGKLVAGHVRSATFVHPWFTSIVWRPDGARWSRSLPLAPDMLGIDEFRRLRVLLRYGRREVTAGSPASHA